MRRNWLILIALLLTALCGPLALPVAGQTLPINSYTATDLGSLGNGQTTAYGLNDAGQVVGQSYTTAHVGHAFVWQAGVMTDLGTLGGISSIANGINNAGQVVGWAETTAGVGHAFLWSPGTGMRDLGTLTGTVISGASGVNDVGEVVGSAITSDGLRHSFLWKNGQMVDLGTPPGYVHTYAYGISSSGSIVGVATDSVGGRRAFRWTPTVPNGTTGVMAALSPSDGNAAYGINASGQAAGEGVTADGSWHAFLWDGSGPIDLGVPRSGHAGDQSSAVYAVNASGLVAGTSSLVYVSYDEGGYQYNIEQWTTAVSWDPVSGFRDLSTNTPDGSFIPITEARGINATGQIAANGGVYYSQFPWLGSNSDSTGTSYLLTPSAVPLPPQYLWSSVGDTRVNLWWSASASAASYNVKRATTSGGQYTTVASGPSTTFTDTAVVNGNTYYYSVTAVNAYGESLPSYGRATPVPPPAAPTRLTAVGGDHQVSLTWNPSPWADYYYVLRGTSPGQYDSGRFLVYGTSYVDIGDYDEYGDFYPLENGVTYYYVVVAENAAGQSGYSNEANATPMPPPPPPAPTGLTATAGDTLVNLAWNASSGAGYYNIKRATSSGGPYALVDSISGTGYTDGGLTNGTTYYYRVSAANDGGESPNSNQASATPTGPPPPNAPTALTATAAAGKKRVDLKWKQSTSVGVTKNRIYRSTIAGGSYSLVTTIAAGTSYTDTSPTSGVTYYYVLTAISSNGKESAYSNQAFARPR